MGFASTILKRTSMENPSFDLNSPAAFEYLGASRSDIGIAVNRKTALGFAPWWRAVTLISNTVGKVPFHTYRRVKSQFGEGKERATDHPIYQRLRYEPNEEQTIDVFLSQLTGHAVSGGNGYAFIDRKAMTPNELWPLDPEHTLPIRVKPATSPNAPGILQYVWTNGVTGITLDPHSVLHIKGFGFDGMCGYNVVELLKDALGLGLGQQKFMVIAIKNGASPRVVLEIPSYATPKQIEFLRETWDAMHAGIDNAHRTAILQGGTKANKIGFSPDDIKLIDSRKLSLVDVANIAGLPVHKVGGEGSRSYASLEQENQAFLDDALDFWLCRWEHECRKKLLSEKEKAADSIVVEFLRSALVRMDSTTKAIVNRVSLGGHPYETVNEVRARDNLNPVEGGDVIPKPLNMGNTGGINNNPDDPAADNVKPTGPNSGNGDANKKRSSEPIDKLLADAQRRAVRRIATHAEKASKQPREFGNWLDRMPAEHDEAVRNILAPAYSAWLLWHDTEGDPAKRASEFLDSIRAELLEVSGKAVTGKQLSERITAWAAEKEKPNAT